MTALLVLISSVIFYFIGRHSVQPPEKEAKSVKDMYRRLVIPKEKRVGAVVRPNADRLKELKNPSARDEEQEVERVLDAFPPV